MRRVVVLLSGIALVLAFGVTVMAANSVSSVIVAEKKVSLTASEGVEKIRYFTLDSPKRLVVDLYGVQPGEQVRDYSLSNGFKKLRVGPYEDKTRFVFDVSGDKFPTFNVSTENSQVVVTWQTAASGEKVAAEASVVGSSQVTDIDFKSEAGKSIFLIDVAGDAKASKVTRDGNKLQFTLRNTSVPRSLRRPFDTLAFPSAILSLTPYLVSFDDQPQVRFAVVLKGDVPYQLQKTNTGYEFIVTDGQFATAYAPQSEILPVPLPGDTAPAPSAEMEPVAEVPLQPAPVLPVIQQVEDSGRQYTGEKTTLVFDNADVRDILRLIAEISNLNIIASEEVKGNVTLRLVDVPWDQALELILDITDLGMIQEGNVVRVLPKSKIRTMKEADLRAMKTQEDQSPTETRVFTVSYADLTSVQGPVEKILSPRGSITADSRNKFLIITDVPTRLQEAEGLIAILDTPERQVMIEARIIEVNSNFSRDLGVNWGLDFNNPGHKFGSAGIGLGGGFLVGLPEGPGSAATEPGLGAGFTFGRIGIDQTILDLRISALETNGKAKVVSMPKVTTLNGEEATISQGTSIPYQTSGADGPKTEFVNAELKLSVTPVINPDNSVILDILATNDSPSITAGASAPSIDTKKAETKVLVQDGETTVIGGIFVENTSDNSSGTPWLMDLPFLGHLFKSTKDTNSRSELLIFITPRIMQSE